MHQTQSSPLIRPIINELMSAGASLTDKAFQSLEIAADDAASRSYVSIYDDSLLTGLLRSQSSITHLVSQLGIDPQELISAIHEPLPNVATTIKELYPLPDYLYMRQRRQQRRLRDGRLGQRAYDTIGYAYDEFGRRTEAPSIPNGLLKAGQVGTDDLLLSVLKMPAVWHHMHNAGVSVNKVRRHAQLMIRVEPDIETQKLILTYSDGRFRINLFDFMDAAAIAHHQERTDKGIYVVSSNVITPAVPRIQDEIERFEYLINTKNVSEYEIQRFIEDHPDLLLGIEHKRLHSQLTLTRDGNSDLRPDFFLERLDGSLCDIIDLKLPDARLVVGKDNRRTFSASVMSALGQLSEYGRYFDDSANRKLFSAKYGLDAFKPQISVVIGRSREFRSPIERESLRSELSNLQIITYDDVLNKAKRRLELISKSD